MSEPSNTGQVLEKHITPLSDLDALGAGRLHAGTAARILAAERSRRVLMLRAVVEAARKCGARAGGPLAPLSTAIALLGRAERTHPGVVTELLVHPGTGVWAVRVLERLRAADSSTRPDGDEPAHAPRTVPLWVELGHLHCVAASAALRAGVAGSVRLPVRDGGVVLPTLGRITLPATTAGADVAVLLVNAPAAVPRSAHAPRATVAHPAPAPPDPAPPRAAPPTGPALATSAAPVPPPAPAAPAAPPTVATLRAGPSRVGLPADLSLAAPGWQPLRTVAWRNGDRSAATLTLEDLDPYRDFRPAAAPPPPLTRARSEEWQRLVRAAGELLHARHPRAAELLGLACRTVVPLPPAPRFRNASASYSEAFGSALISLPGDARELAVTAVHEARHSVLNALLHQLPLCGDTRPDGSPLLLHAPWRGDPRPPSGLLHGVYAFAGVAAFWRVERHSLTGPEAVLAHFEYALWRQAVGEVAETLRHHEVLTAWGRRFVDRVADEAAGWADDHVPEASRAPALAELADRRATWRARHTVPHPEGVRALARACLAGADPAEQPAVPSQVRVDHRYLVTHPRGELRRLRLLDADSLPRHAHGPVYGAGRAAAAVAADVDLLTGHHAAAARGYLAELTRPVDDATPTARRSAASAAADAGAGPADPAAWAGLGLALAGTGAAHGAGALRHRPELVGAVWRSMGTRNGRSPDPVAVAEWIGRSPRLLTAPPPRPAAAPDRPVGRPGPD